ncbi:MAG: class I SAM-dependent methyltransferase [Caulobacteraceae bacterium]|nr:class I SAM-dependent methyltransferase [Caulobacteraceae bacterium]
MAFDRSILDHRDKCPLCDERRHDPLVELDGFHIVRCASCRFIYVVEVIPDAICLDYYANGYAGLRHRQGQQINADMNVNILKTIKPPINGRALLDIGSGFGFLLDRARDKLGMNVTGVELSNAERKFANESLGVKTVRDLDDVPAGSKFDVISLFEVVEHLKDPRALLGRAADMLKAGGYLVVGTDNFESNPVRVMGEGFPKWIPHQHISLFGPDSLRRLCTMTGAFSIRAEASYTPWEYQARMAVQRLSRGRRGVRKFNLEQELASEEGRGFALFPLRRLVNPLYARLARRNTLDAAMMYVIAQRN